VQPVWLILNIKERRGAEGAENRLLYYLLVSYGIYLEY
jgi:hypothetical protein